MFKPRVFPPRRLPAFLTRVLLLALALGMLAWGLVVESGRPSIPPRAPGLRVHDQGGTSIRELHLARG